MISRPQFFERIHKNDIVGLVWGSMLSLFYGSIIISTFVHGDFNITEGSIDSKLPNIVLVSQLCVGLSLFLSFLHRKFFGILATAFALVSTLIIVYFNIKNTPPAGVLLVGVFIIVFLLLGPSMYVLFSSFRSCSWQTSDTDTL